ncbi:MAG: hypothetical protein LAP38_00440 [Acidobacteriia bacterium]|nr:hypothetical protein [Terriglobia bacterium]
MPHDASASNTAFAILGDDREKSASGGVGFSAALLPFLERSRIDAEGARELGLRHFVLGADALHVDFSGQHDPARRKFDLGLDVGQNFLGASSSVRPSLVRFRAVVFDFPS